VRPARLIVIAIVMMAAAVPARAQGHGAAPAHGTAEAKGGPPAHGAEPAKPAAAEPGDKTVKAAAPTPAAAAKPAPAVPARGTSASAALARIVKRLDQELLPAQPKGKAAGSVGSEAENAHAGSTRSGASRGRRPAERPRMNLEWRLSVAWTTAADALSGRHPAEEDSLARPAPLKACANPLHFHLEAGASQLLLRPPVLPHRPNP
jgi:hypothetical protein